MKKKGLRVCHITSAHPANDIRIFHKECASLAENGYDVHLVAPGILSSDTKGVVHHTIPISKHFGRLGRMLFRARQAYRLAKNTQANIFHFHDPELLPYGLWLKWQGHVVIYDAHEDLPRDILEKNWIPFYLRKSVSTLMERMENYIARRVDRVITATPFICKRFQAIGANAIEVKNFPRLDELYTDSPRVSSSSVTHAVCYVGIISLQRGIVEMIKAIEHLNVRLILAGNFVDKKTEQFVHSLPGWDKVDFRGMVSRSGIRDIFSESDLGLCLFHPSNTHNESMPNKLFEYMAAELPVLSSNFVGWTSIVEHANCGICVDPNNIEIIAQSIQWLLDNPDDAKQMGKRGKTAVEQNYNWTNEAKRLLNVYSEFL